MAALTIGECRHVLWPETDPGGQAGVPRQPPVAGAGRRPEDPGGGEQVILVRGVVVVVAVVVLVVVVVVVVVVAEMQKTYERANNVCVKCLLAWVKFEPISTLVCCKSELCRDFGLFGVIFSTF